MGPDSTVEDLVLANRILANEGILDAFGHVTARHPDGDRMFVSHYQSPALVSAEDVIEMAFDGTVLTPDVEDTYSETVIHRAIYRNRDDVGAVVHHHAADVLPFTVSEVPIRPIVPSGALFRDGVPTFSDYDTERGRLVVTEGEGERVAAVLGDRPAMLLEGHGANVVGANVREAVIVTMHLVKNVRQQYAALALGEPRYYTDEVSMATMVEEVTLRERTVDRYWDYLVERLPES